MPPPHWDPQVSVPCRLRGCIKDVLIGKKSLAFWQTWLHHAPRKQPPRICHPPRKIENVHAHNRGPPSKIKHHKPKRCFPENHLAARKNSRDAKVTRTTSYATWTALASRPAKTRRTSVMISSLLLSASLRPTCKPMVFGRRMITKAKMQKGKKQKSQKPKKKEKGRMIRVERR